MARIIAAVAIVVAVLIGYKEYTRLDQFPIPTFTEAEMLQICIEEGIPLD